MSSSSGVFISDKDKQSDSFESSLEKLADTVFDVRKAVTSFIESDIQGVTLIPRPHHIFDGVIFVREGPLRSSIFRLLLKLRFDEDIPTHSLFLYPAPFHPFFSELGKLLLPVDVIKDKEYDILTSIMQYLVFVITKPFELVNSDAIFINSSLVQNTTAAKLLKTARKLVDKEDFDGVCEYITKSHECSQYSRKLLLTEKKTPDFQGYQWYLDLSQPETDEDKRRIEAIKQRIIGVKPASRESWIELLKSILSL
ncbi:hypothetical protein ADUPG1_010373 [Aduncisulcus paluster]|uniref:BTB domain-containing protein n=1 Tax=Aduncisulcus paluster TaxID=2918883 RepID=A0ABQ5JR51_9EUKA|nr:hypothetical protein ADUPG1_010373 [Aduncisulcus paluster]